SALIHTTRRKNAQNARHIEGCGVLPAFVMARRGAILLVLPRQFRPEFDGKRRAKKRGDRAGKGARRRTCESGKARSCSEEKNSKDLQ
ncbi:MAG: hypothetical protein WBD19_14165, partial [Candidatus Acidiferrum sp.]